MELNTLLAFFVRDIGYDMFAKLFEEEGKKIKGETFEREKESNSEIDLNVIEIGRASCRERV